MLGGLNTAEAEEAAAWGGWKSREEAAHLWREHAGHLASLARFRAGAEEKNEANLVQQNIETDEQSDPMFRRMAAAFDAGGAKGLLLSHLPLAEAGKCCGSLGR